MGTNPRWVSFALSVLVHAVSLVVLVAASGAFPAEAPVLHHYQVSMLPKEAPEQDKVIWYDFHASVPEVSPGKPFGPGKIPQGIKDPAGRTVIAHSPEPASNKQFIWQPDHSEPIPADVPVPNQVVLQPSSPKAPLKQFSPPTPASPPGKPPTVALIDPVPAVEAPKLPLTVNTLGDLAKQDPASLPQRPRFVAPAKATTSTGTVSVKPLPEAPLPGVAGGATGDGLKAVIVGLDPAPGPAPLGSRPGQFSRAPTAGPPSSGAASQPGAPTVPGLLSHSASGAPPVESAPVPVNVPIPERHLLKDLVMPSITRTMSVPLRPSSRIIPASVEARFPGRDVYTLLIPGPSLPEYTGDWVLWFSERHPPDDHAARIVAPVPVRKYYLTGATAATPQESGTIQLDSIVDHKGHVSGVRILRGGATGEAFRAKAIEELETWEFQPALRNGEPIDVDVVLEVSFRFGAVQPAR